MHTQVCPLAVAPVHWEELVEEFPPRLAVLLAQGSHQGLHLLTPAQEQVPGPPPQEVASRDREEARKI